MHAKYDVAAYIWPAYTGDEPRARMFWPEGMGEWQSVRSAGAKYPGHEWPRRPLWGYVNEADRYVMKMQIDAALYHGVNVFIYDWYWYDGRPFLEQCLNDGFLKAPNCGDMRFYLMWANHDAVNLWDKRLSGDAETTVWRGGVNRAEFEKVADRLIERYFRLPNYYRIDGKPAFMIYDVPNFAAGLGGAQAARDALQWFKRRAAEAGLPGLHLQFTLWSERATNLSGVDGGKDVPAGAFGSLGFDSASHYQFVHFADIDRDYAEILKDVADEWRTIERRLPLPYFPHISVGWDNNPRFGAFRPGVVRGNTPEKFAEGLRMARGFIDRHPDRAPLITVNSWNEWTETSYLQPDDRYGYGYLEAVRRVFIEEPAAR